MSIISIDDQGVYISNKIAQMYMYYQWRQSGLKCGSAYTYIILGCGRKSRACIYYDFGMGQKK